MSESADRQHIVSENFAPLWTPYVAVSFAGIEQAPPCPSLATSNQGMFAEAEILYKRIL
jgi:hypothetical protein